VKAGAAMDYTKIDDSEIIKFNNGKTLYDAERITHWNKIADSGISEVFSSVYRKLLYKKYHSIIPDSATILEIGCGTGDLLAALKPSNGIGIDFSNKMIEIARNKYPQLQFYCIDACSRYEQLEGKKFDYIIISDLLNDIWDVQSCLEEIYKYTNHNTRIIINFYSRVWQWALSIGQKLKVAKPTLLQNWLTKDDVNDLLRLSNFEPIKSWEDILLPISIPIINPLFNKYLSKIWPFKIFDLVNFIVARPSQTIPGKQCAVSIVIPARNEEGNIEEIFLRVPKMGSGVELLFVEGNSSDNTYKKIEDMILKYPEKNAKLLKQDGVGKGDAVRKGFASANGDILMILDADLTVPPEDLPRFYSAIASNKGEFINGVRLVYPMEKEAMQFLNFLGNKSFSFLFTWLLGQTVKDTLCGTKVLWRKDYEIIASNRKYFGDFDPFGDFDLLFGAAKLCLKILDMPIRYRERKYGTTNIQRWKHGLLLLKMVNFAASRIKFI
jgi:ubiquinone/menaquinone biosynthesis C-methylase UbiE